MGAAGIAHERFLLGGVDPLGDGLHATVVGHEDDGLDQRGVQRGGFRAGHERLVDLDRFQGIAAQVAKAVIPRAEVIQHQAVSSLRQVEQYTVLVVTFQDQQALGDLELDAGRLHAVFFQQLFQFERKRQVAQLLGRDIDRDRDIPARFFRHGNEFGRQHLPQFLVAPPEQCFHAGDLTAHQRIDRLIAQVQLFMGQAMSQQTLQPCMLLRALLHRCIIEAEQVCAPRLGLVHGDIGIAEHIGEILSVVGNHRDPDTRPDQHVLAAHLNGARQQGMNLVDDP